MFLVEAEKQRFLSMPFSGLTLVKIVRAKIEFLRKRANDMYLLLSLNV